MRVLRANRVLEGDGLQVDKGSLLTLGAAVFLPLLLFAALQTAFGLQLQRRQVENEALANAREVVALVDGQLWADHSALSVASTSVAIAEGDFKTAYERIKRLDDSRARWVNVVLTDAVTRREIWETAAPFGQTQPLRPDVAAYPRLLQAEAAAKEIKAFADAAPDQQPDAE